MKSGVTLLEVVLSVAMLVVIFVSVYPVVGWLITRSKQLQYDSQAAIILQQGAEVAYNVFLDDWDSFGEGNYRYAVSRTDPGDGTSPDGWTLVPMAVGEVDEVGMFGRTIRVSPVCRLVNGTGEDQGKLQSPPEPNPGCDAGYAIDPDSKLVTTSVDWREKLAPKHIQATLLITKL